MILAKNNLIDWRQEQLQDPEISVFLLGKKIDERPAWQEIASKGTAAKVYWSYWDSLEIQNGVLYKKWETPNLKNTVIQLIFPKPESSKFWKKRMILLPEDILGLIKLWRRSGRDSIGHPVNRMWKSGADLVKSVLQREIQQEKESLLCKFTMLELHSRESK